MQKITSKKHQNSSPAVTPSPPAQALRTQSRRLDFFPQVSHTLDRACAQHAPGSI